MNYIMAALRRFCYNVRYSAFGAGGAERYLLTVFLPQDNLLRKVELQRVERVVDRVDE